MATQNLDERIGIAELRGEMVQMNKRMDDMRSDIQDLRATLRWVIGIQITMFIVLAGLILRGIGS